MRIVLATPLYPPDIGEASFYAKEAARRLSEKHEVTVLAFGHLPESVPNVHVVSISKKLPKILRLIKFTQALISAARKADVLYLQNGASVELPAVLATLIVPIPLVFHIADAAAHGRSRKSFAMWFIQSLAHNHAKFTFADMPLTRPEILPFEPVPRDTLEKYESSWREHLGTLERILRHG